MLSWPLNIWGLILLPAIAPMIWALAIIWGLKLIPAILLSLMALVAILNLIALAAIACWVGAPMICVLLTIWGLPEAIESGAGDSIDCELIVDIRPLAHHAGYL
jgi:hypothetical protein